MLSLEHDSSRNPNPSSHRPLLILCRFQDLKTRQIPGVRLHPGLLQPKVISCPTKLYLRMKRSRELGEELDYSRNSEDIEKGSATENTSLPTAKSLLLDSDLVDEEASDRNIIKCSLPPHREPIAFKSHEEYESHYARFHTNRCLECRNNFPSEHLLSVHIEEWHDPLARIKREKGEHTVSEEPITPEGLLETDSRGSIRALWRAVSESVSLIKSAGFI